MVEDIDSLDPRLETYSDGLLGGRAGDEPVDCFLGGSRGGGIGLLAADGVTFCPVRVTLGGGKTPFLWTPLGSFPMPLLA